MINTNGDIILCSEVRLFLLGVMMLIELNDLSHSGEDMAIVEIVVKSGLNVATFEESFVSLNSRNPLIVDFSFN